MKIILRIQVPPMAGLNPQILGSLNPVFELKKAMSWIQIFKDPSQKEKQS
jgi:hypothetical protein